MLAMGMPLPLVESMLSYYVAGVRNGKMYAPASTMGDVLGRPARSFEEWVRDHRAMLAWRGHGHFSRGRLSFDADF